MESHSQSKISKSTREKRDRQERLMAGLCTRCGKSPPKENRRLCEKCGDKGVRYVTDHRYKKTITEDDDDDWS